MHVCWSSCLFSLSSEDIARTSLTLLAACGFSGAGGGDGVGVVISRGVGVGVGAGVGVGRGRTGWRMAATFVVVAFCSALLRL